MKQEKRVAVDTHTHTVLSGHAWSTLLENAKFAAELGLAGICCTEHGPQLPGGPPFFISRAHHMLPTEVLGIKVYMGLEFNIVDYNGRLDVEGDRLLKGVAFGIASMHDVTLQVASKSDHTSAYIGALENPYVDLAGHPGTPNYPCDIEAVVLGAKAKNKLIEINENSFYARQGGRDNCLEFARQCMRHDVRVCVSSDAHFATAVGQTPQCFALLDEVGFPDELIVNLVFERFEAYLQERAARLAL